MKLTPFAKTFIAIVLLAVIGVVVWLKFGDQIKGWATDGKAGTVAQGDQPAKPADNTVTKNDFNALGNAPADPKRNEPVSGVAAANLGAGKLGRPLVVGINTWAGHAPGVVFNRGLDPNPQSLYQKEFGLEVKFVLLEDPAAKLAAFKKGDVDVMWDTVDNWAREASGLAETSFPAKSIIMQDWSRGGDGIVSLATIKSVEDLKGKTIACTQFTPSHFLLLFLLNQSGLTPDERNEIEKKIVFTQDAPAAAAMFKAKRVDAAVTWEPDLSGAVSARGDEAHVLVSTSAATNVIADTLVARGDVIEKAPETLKAFVHGWFKGIDIMKDDPTSSYAIVGQALKLDNETVSGMLSGLKLTPFADNAQFYGLTGGRAHFDTLFDTAFVIWRKKGLVTRAVNAKDYVDTRFVQALASAYGAQKVVETPIAAKAPSVKDRAIINKTIQIHFTPGSDKIMEGSYFVLDSLGETMVSFGNTYLRVEGNTDAVGAANANKTLSEKRAIAVKNYLVKEFPMIQGTRFQTIGRGEENPVADNTTEAGRQLNRRTDIKVVLATQ
ncbi:MAG: OmpA family protein [Deltaproteobacteria bacterium]|nr:OmpA family protein [Deltaproteobacteria bacterium]